MKKEVKDKTITFGELKEMKITMPKKWLDDLYRRYSGKESVEINIKDIINKILKANKTNKQTNE